MKVGDEVGWRWANGIATGTIIEISPERTEIQSSGKLIVRNGTAEDPAIVIKHKSGNQVLKLRHELQPIQHS